MEFLYHKLWRQLTGPALKASFVLPGYCGNCLKGGVKYAKLYKTGD